LRNAVEGADIVMQSNKVLATNRSFHGIWSSSGGGSLLQSRNERGQKIEIVTKDHAKQAKTSKFPKKVKTVLSDGWQRGFS